MQTTNNIQKYIMNINVTDQYNEKHVFTISPDENNRITVAELFDACLETAKSEDLELDTIGFRIILESMGGFIKSRLPNIHDSWVLYSQQQQ